MRQTEVTVMFFSKKPKKISAETLIDLKQYIDRCTAADDAAVCEEAAPCAPSYTPPKESAAPPFFGAHAPSMQKRASEHAPLAASPCAAPRMRDSAIADALHNLPETTLPVSTAFTSNNKVHTFKPAVKVNQVENCINP